MDPAEERATIERARADPRAFVPLYDHYFPRVHAYVRYRVGGYQDAEDIIAEVFLRALRGLGSFRWRHENSFAAWLFRIAHNLIVDHYRRSEWVALPDGALEGAAPTPETEAGDTMRLTSRAPRPDQALSQRETFEQMRALVATLSPRRREVISLRFFGGLRNKEIAGILDLDERTVASHLSRGLQDLRERYTAQTAAHALEGMNV